MRRPPPAPARPPGPGSREQGARPDVRRSAARPRAGARRVRPMASSGPGPGRGRGAGRADPRRSSPRITVSRGQVAGRDEHRLGRGRRTRDRPERGDHGDGGEERREQPATSQDRARRTSPCRRGGEGSAATRRRNRDRACSSSRQGGCHDRPPLGQLALQSASASRGDGRPGRRTVPTYQYACTECGHFFEQFQSFSEDALTCARSAGPAPQGVQRGRRGLQGLRLLPQRLPARRRTKLRHRVVEARRQASRPARRAERERHDHQGASSSSTRSESSSSAPAA